MAVVQISRIQLRRGQKNSVSGIPQLSSAEMAWAVDAQELYIGNGSVAEGAPYVGNTRLLTEHENILALISSYQYAADDLAMAQYTVDRSIQSKLDEHVSIADFGGYPDTENIAEIFNNALTHLYSGTLDSKYKKVLTIPNGTYTFEADLHIPSDVILRGETPFGVVFDIGEHNIKFTSSDGLAFENINSENYPQHVNISNIIINRTTGQLILSGLKHSTFNDVMIQGGYTLDTVLSNPFDEVAALGWENIGASINTTDIIFNRCLFVGNSISIRVINSVNNDSTIRFNDCEFVDNYFGTLVDGIPSQGTFWTYKNCTFEKIYRQAFKSTAGKGTVIRNSTFIKVGNGAGLSMYPVYPMVEFGERAGNIVVDCYGDRMQHANVQPTSSIYAIPEVRNSDTVSFLDKLVATFNLTDTLIPFAVLSASENIYTINYVVRLGELYRKGQLTIAIGNTVNPGNEDISIFDNFTCSPNLSLTPAGIVISNLQLSISIHDNNSDGINDTIALLYRNDIEHIINEISTSGITGDISFDISYGN